MIQILEGEQDTDWRWDFVSGKLEPVEVMQEVGRVSQFKNVNTRRGFILNEIPLQSGILEVYKADTPLEMIPANKLVQVFNEPGVGEYVIDTRTGSIAVNPSIPFNTIHRIHYIGIGSGKNVKNDYFIQSQVAEKSMVGLGSIIFHTIHLPGSYTLTQMRARGFAVCDGTTAADQGIIDPSITGILPDLITGGKFIRSALSSGVFQDDLTSTNGLSITGGTKTFVDDLAGIVDRNPPLGAFGSIPSGYQNFSHDGGGLDDIATGPQAEYQFSQRKSTISVSVSGGIETRPKNMSAIPMMRVK